MKIYFRYSRFFNQYVVKQIAGKHEINNYFDEKEDALKYVRMLKKGNKNENN